MGNMGLLHVESRRCFLQRLHSEITRACTEKNPRRLERLLRDHRVIEMTEDVRTHVLTQDTLLECLRDTRGPAPPSGAQQDDVEERLSLDPRGLDCASLVLAVLVAREFLATHAIPPGHTVLSAIWKWPPHTALCSLLDEAAGEAAALRRWIINHAQGRHDLLEEQVGCILLAAAALRFDFLFQPPWSRTHLCNFFLYNPSHIVLATVCGSQDLLRHLLDPWYPPVFAKYASQCLMFVLMLGQAFGPENLDRSSIVFKEMYKRSRLQIQDFLGCILKVVCGDENQTPTSSILRPNFVLHLLVRYADFFFDASVVPDDEARDLFACPWDPVRNFIVLFHLYTIPEPVCRLCFQAFENLCERGGAGLFLVALQDDDTLGELPVTHRGQLILYLAERQYAIQDLFPTLSYCELCLEPIASFLLWMLSGPSPLDSCLHPKDLVRYCLDTYLPLFEMIQDNTFDLLCEMHLESIPEPRDMTAIIDKCNSYRYGATQ